MDDVKGSATGAQVGSFLWGAAASALFLALGWGSAYWWVGVPVYLFAASAWARSLALGVRVGQGEVVVNSWFRRRRFVEGEASAINLVHYYGFGGGAIGWVPGFGTVRMIEVELTTGWRVYLPSTIGRRNSVLRLARRMRVALGLNPH